MSLLRRAPRNRSGGLKFPYDELATTGRSSDQHAGHLSLLRIRLRHSTDFDTRSNNGTRERLYGRVVLEWQRLCRQLEQPSRRNSYGAEFHSIVGRYLPRGFAEHHLDRLDGELHGTNL
jgi:hypothetical protein